MKLREYQQEAVVNTRRAIGAAQRRDIDKPRVMMCLPTGSGKTVVAIDMLKRAITKGGANVVWLTHRIELVDQAIARFEQFGLPKERCKVWSVGKAWNRAKDDAKWLAFLIEQGIDDNSIMIVDEAHHAPAKSWAGIIDKFPGYVIGMTATVWRLSNAEGFDHLFDELVVGPRIVDLIDDGYLCKIRQWTIPFVSGVGGGAGGDYAIKATVDQSIKHHTNESAVDWIKDFCGQRLAGKYRMVVFAMSVNHAQVVKDLLNARGFKADFVANQDAMHADQRAKVVDQFRRGELNAVVNVNVLTEGFDLPVCDVVCILRPTKSLALYLQMVGRGTRPAEGKQCLYVLDATDTSQAFGTAVDADAYHEWTLEARGVSPSGNPPTSECDWNICSKCGEANLLHANKVKCDCKDDDRQINVCGHRNPIAAKWCEDCHNELLRKCDTCGNNTNLFQMRTWVGDAKKGKFMGEPGNTCKSCQIDHAQAFQQAYELENYAERNRWRESLNRSGNRWRMRSKNGTQFRLVATPSRLGGYGYMIFLANDRGGKPLASAWKFDEFDEACQACDTYFKTKFLVKPTRKTHPWRRKKAS